MGYMRLLSVGWRQGYGSEDGRWGKLLAGEQSEGNDDIWSDECICAWYIDTLKIEW